MVRSYKSLRFSASSLLSSPSSGPRQPRGMLGTQAWALGQVVGGGGAGAASSLPLPPHLGLTLAPAGGSGRLGRREGG